MASTVGTKRIIVMVVGVMSARYDTSVGLVVDLWKLILLLVFGKDEVRNDESSPLPGVRLNCCCLVRSSFEEKDNNKSTRFFAVGTCEVL